MDLRQILYALRARYLIALLVMAVVVAVVIGATLYLPKQYTAKTSLVVDMRSPEPMAALLAAGNMATQVSIAESDRVVQTAVKLLRLDQDPTITAQWRAETKGKGDVVAWAAARLQRGLTVKPLDASIIEISYKGSDPGFAAAVANAIAQAYTATLVALKVGPATQYAHWFGEQSEALRADLEKAQAHLAAYQKKAGILVTDDRMDAETARLNELSSQLSAVEGQTAEARSRQQTGSAAAELPATRGAVGGDPIQTLRSQIDEKEVALRNASVNLGINHPTYRALQAQLDELKQKLQSETQRVTRNFAVARAVGQRTEADLRAAMAAQKVRLLELQEKRGQMDVLKRDVDRAQAAYDAVAKPLAQTNLESRATDANVTVLTPAVPPVEPTFPKSMPVMVAIGVVLGILAGIGVALLLEMLDRRVRNAQDLAVMLDLPVLGVIESGRGRPLALPRARTVPLLRSGA